MPTIVDARLAQRGTAASDVHSKPHIKPFRRFSSTMTMEAALYLRADIRTCTSSRPLLIVLSHLRWDFVFQRPQHLLSRAAKYFDVCFIEEPIYEGTSSTVRTMQRAGGVQVIQPLLPVGTDPGEALIHQGDIAE